MNVTDLKERVRAILESAIEDSVHPDLESTLSEIIADYESFTNNNDADAIQYKYDQLKAKYIDRFLNGDPDNWSETDPIDPVSAEPVEDEEAEDADITVEELFEEEEKK